MSSPRIPDRPSGPVRTSGASPSGSTELLVRSGRGTSVATDALLAHIPQLRELADRVDVERFQVMALTFEASADTAFALSPCEPVMHEVAARARWLAAALESAQSSYAHGEAAVVATIDSVSVWFAAALGSHAWRAAPVAGINVMRAWSSLPGTDAEKREKLQRWILANPQVYTNPEFVHLVRRIAEGADDAVLGAAGVPVPVLLLLGPHGLGLLGTDTSARAVMTGAALLGGTHLRETKVQVHRAGEPVAVTPARTPAEHFANIPGEEQVKIIRLQAPGLPDKFVVYVAPTQTFSLDATGDPWDSTSNLAGVAGMSAGSIRATELAMVQAGVTDASEVMVVGYSQGGLVAGSIAASGKWNVVALQTFGAPGGVDLPPEVRGLTVVHSDDFIPAAGGTPPGTDHVIVERRAFPEGTAIPTSDPIPAHLRPAYAETARLLDGAQSPQLRAELDAIARFTGDYTGVKGSTATAYSYQAERVLDHRPSGAQ